MNQVSKHITTPIGRMQLFASSEHITQVRLPNHIELRPAAQLAPAEVQRGAGSTELRSARKLLDLAERQLLQYFHGERTEFELPLGAVGTEFQRAVWRGLTEIPHGTTMSYAELAQRIGRPKACRAVGAANRKNPLSVIVPCHRVVGSDGSLTGFAGGLPLKRWLLEHEAR